MLLCRWPLYTIACTILQVLVNLHVLIFIKMYLYLLVYFFILSVNLKLIHLIDPLPSVFISLFIIILILEMGAWLEGCFKEQSRINLSACLLTN